MKSSPCFNGAALRGGRIATMRRHNLHQNSMLPASEAASELAEALRSRLPEQIRRDELWRFCYFMLPVIPVFFGAHLPSAKPAV